jgi:hypothetical protein
MPGYTVYDQKGTLLFGANTKLFPAQIEVSAGGGEFVFEIDSIPLLDGDYPVTIGILTHDEYTVYDWHEQQYVLSVINHSRHTGLLLVPTAISSKQFAPSQETANPLPSPPLTEVSQRFVDGSGVS